MIPFERKSLSMDYRSVYYLHHLICWHPHISLIINNCFPTLRCSLSLCLCSSSSLCHTHSSLILWLSKILYPERLNSVISFSRKLPVAIWGQATCHSFLFPSHPGHTPVFIPVIIFACVSSVLRGQNLHLFTWVFLGNTLI